MTFWASKGFPWSTNFDTTAGQPARLASPCVTIGSRPALEKALNLHNSIPTVVASDIFAWWIVLGAIRGETHQHEVIAIAEQRTFRLRSDGTSSRDTAVHAKIVCAVTMVALEMWHVMVTSSERLMTPIATCMTVGAARMVWKSFPVTDHSIATTLEIILVLILFWLFIFFFSCHFLLFFFISIFSEAWLFFFLLLFCRWLFNASNLPELFHWVHWELGFFFNCYSGFHHLQGRPSLLFKLVNGSELTLYDSRDTFLETYIVFVKSSFAKLPN